MLKGLSFLFGSALAALGAAPVVGAWLSPLLRKGQQAAGDFFFACDAADLEVGVPKRVDLISTVIDGWARSEGAIGSAWILKRPDGQVQAFSTICPHSGCSIAFGSKAAFSCPCHDSAFSLEGVPLTGPSPRPMDALEVEPRGRQIFVRYARFKPGVRQKEEI